MKRRLWVVQCHQFFSSLSVIFPLLRCHSVAYFARFRPFMAKWYFFVVIILLIVMIVFVHFVHLS